MINRNVPKAWAEAAVKKSIYDKNSPPDTSRNFGILAKNSPVTESKKLTARVDMSEQVAGAGLCPACKQPMDECMANGHKGLVCHPDRVFLPAADSQ